MESMNELRRIIKQADQAGVSSEDRRAVFDSIKNKETDPAVGRVLTPRRIKSVLGRLTGEKSEVVHGRKSEVGDILKIGSLEYHLFNCQIFALNISQTDLLIKWMMVDGHYCIYDEPNLEKQS